MNARLLVAGVGNIFCSDDGFGSAVIRALQTDRLENVKIEDFGIAGMHLAFELTAGYERAIVVDLTARGGTPGTLYVIEPEAAGAGPAPDAHRMDLSNVFAFVGTLGGAAPPIEIVGCEPQTVDEGIGLSPPVAAAVEPAAGLVRKLIARARSASGRKGEPLCFEA